MRDEPGQFVPCAHLSSSCWGMPSGLDLRALWISLEILNVFVVQGQCLMPLKPVGLAAAFKESVHMHPKTAVCRAPWKKTFNFC